MAVPSTIVDLSTTAASNSPAGADTVASGTGPDDYLRALSAIVRREQAQATAVASATTVDLGAITTGNYVHITGTTTITGFGTVAAGIERTVVFDGALTLTHSASLILPGGANITTAAGDCAVFRSEGSGNWRCVSYEMASGAPVGSFQPLDAELTAIAGLTSAANTVPYFTGSGTASLKTIGASSGNIPLVGTSSATEALAGLVELATSAEVAAGTDTARAITPAGLAASKIVSGTAVESTSGTSIDFTGIPAYCKRITVMFAGVSTNGTASVLIQLGDSGGIEATGYASNSTYLLDAGTAGATSSTSGFIVRSAAASNTFRGSFTISLIDGSSFSWVGSGVFASGSSTTTHSAGSKSLTAALDRVRVTTENGTDTFDAGTVNILYE